MAQRIRPKSQSEKRIDALALKEGGGANWFVAVEEPKEEEFKINDGDYWAKIDDITAKNLLGVYRWDGEEKKWVEAYNIKEVSVEGGVGVFVNDAKNAERFNDYSADGIAKAAGIFSHTEGYDCEASGNCAHAEGQSTTASGLNSHSEGQGTLAKGKFSHAEGLNTQANADYSHTEGSATKANQSYSHAEGQNVVVDGSWSHGGGMDVEVKNAWSFAHGRGLITSSSQLQAVFGMYNEVADDSIFVLGRGSAAVRRNLFRVIIDGSAWIAGSYQTDGGDYAEPYEWEDKNPYNEDRVGLFVTFNGDKLRLATSEDTYILGVVSAVPSVLGKAYSNHWKGKYKRDIFERPILDEEGNKILSEDYDPTQTYIPRRLRAEKAPIGTQGQLIVIDDGTCEINGYCGVADGGIGTKCDDIERVYRGLAFRVIERLDETHIRIVIK